MIKDGGEWKSVDWETALEFVARGLKGTSRTRHGGAALGTLISPHATLEEMALAARLDAGARLGQRRFPAAPVGFPR